VPAGTTYGQPAQITGATITVGPNGTYSFTAIVAGTYTYTIPVCAPGQTINCPTETLVITVPVNTLTNDTESAFINIPKTGNISTNDIVPVGTTYGQPAQLTGATITIGANGTYTFTATVAGTYTYTVPVCAPGQTTNCPTETLVVTVTDPTPPTPPVVSSLNPDFGATNISVPLSGNISTNDNVPAGTSYGQPAANASNPTGATISMNANGTYSFNATKPGTYTYYVPVCPAGQTTGCPVTPLVITVVDPMSNTNPPIANPDIATTIVNTSVTTNVLANDKASNMGTSLNAASLSIATAPKNGTAVVNSDGSITYTPATGFVGTDSVTYTVCDNSTPTPICKSAVVYYTVSAANAIPATTASDDFAKTPVGNPISGNVLLNDKNTAGALLTVTSNTSLPASKGIFILNPDGTYTFTPAPGFTGPVDIVYTVCSGSPAVCSNATLHILVEPVIPTKVFEITKTAKTAKMNVDGSFNIDFVIKVKNLTNNSIDSILVKDDLTKVFANTNGVSVVSVIVSGKLMHNNSYNGIVNTDLLLIQSALDPNKEDSILLTINVPSSQSGNFENTAVVTAPTPFGFVQLNSTDPRVIVGVGDTTRKPTLFIIPKVEVIIPGGFSPNNDGIDDTWVITRPYGTTISVKVFNRWGNEVYSNANYQNDWRGLGVSNFMGQNVPEGTYFYIVEAIDQGGVLLKLNGSLTIVR
jgi:gliding motility-associated-like protein